jgi:hypothetical protein
MEGAMEFNDLAPEGSMMGPMTGAQQWVLETPRRLPSAKFWWLIILTPLKLVRVLGGTGSKIRIQAT